MILRHLIIKEFIRFRRNAFLPRLVVVFPIMVMCVMPWVMNMEVRNIVVQVGDNDRSTASQQLVHAIEASRYFIFGGEQPSYAAAMQAIGDGVSDVVVVLPPHFGRDLDMGHRPTVLIAANAVNGTKGSIGATYLSQIVTAATLRRAMSGGNVQVLNLYNKRQDYKVFMIPALMGIIMMMICGFLPALNIVDEKESGTIEQINVTPVPKWAFILAKLIPYWLMAVVVMSLCFVLAWAIYGITCQGNLLLVYMLSILVAMFFSSLGLIVSNYSDTLQQAMLVMWFFVVCLMLLSGLFTPVRSMPHWAQVTTWFNPMHYYIDAMRTVFVRGGGFGDISRQAGALVLASVTMGVWAVASYRKHT